MRRSVARPLVLLLAAMLLAGTATLASAAQIATILTISASPNPIFVGQSTTVTYTVTPKPDGGGITFGGPIHPLDVATGTYTEVRTYSAYSAPVISARFTGTDAFAATPFIEYQVELKQHHVTAALSLPGAPIGRGDAFDLTLDLDEDPGSGRVLIQDMTNGNPGPTLRYVNVTGPQPMTIAMPGMEPGDYQIRASYEGAPAYTTATSPTVALHIFDRVTTTSIAATPGPTLLGAPVVVTTQVVPIPDDGGTVRISRDGLAVGWFTMDWSLGAGTFTFDQMTAGDHLLKAEYFSYGDPVSRWAPSTATTMHTVSTTPIETDPPVGTVLIDGGADVTASGYAVISMHATDASGIVRTQMSCDGSSWINAGVADGDWGWGFGDVSAGCDDSDGVWNIYVRWQDRWGTWGGASDSIILDVNAPIGTVTLDAGAATTESSTVSVDAPATDAGSGVSQIALSNDGTHWTTMSYAPALDWVTGGSTDGMKTVFVKWRDGNLHWSSATSDTIVRDVAAPVTTAPTRTVLAATNLSAGAVTARVAWTGTDAGSGVATYALEQRTDMALWTPISTTLTSPAVNRQLAQGHTYAFRVRAVDHVGHVGTWATGSTFRLTSYSELSSAVRYTGRWSASISTAYWGGKAKASSSAGAKATFTFTGRSVALVSRLAPGRGKAEIWVGSTKVATIDLNAATYSNQRIVWSKAWSTSAKRTVTIKVLGTSGRPRIDIDGFVVGS